MKLPTVSDMTPISDKTTTDPDLESISFGERLKPAPSTSALPRLESMDTVLLQALKTNDNTLMDSVLNNTNEEIIRKTIEKLPQSAVLPFLSYVVRKYFSDSKVVPWVRLVLISHTPYLITVPDLPEKISQLYSLIESQLNAFGDFVRLQGRLNLLMTQVNPKESSMTKMVSKTPLNVFKEIEEEEDMVVDDQKQEKSKEEEFYMDFYEGDEGEDEEERARMLAMSRWEKEDKYIKTQLWENES